jgi:hypothetical protein
MRHKTRTTVRRCAAGQVSLGLFAFFITANLHIKDNGMGKITLVYPAASMTSNEIEKRRYDSETTRATSVRIDRGKTLVRVLFADVNRLAEVPEFRNTTFALERGADGTARLRAQVRATVLGNVTSDGLARIKVSLPGPIVASNAQESTGTEARWAVPVTRYFSHDGIDLDATYRARTASGPPPDQQARNSADGGTP